MEEVGILFALYRFSVVFIYWFMRVYVRLVGGFDYVCLTSQIQCALHFYLFCFVFSSLFFHLFH